MDKREKPIANPSVVLREEFDDWAVLFDPETGHAFGLNPTGVLLWKLIDGENTRDDLLTKVRGFARDVPEDAADHIASFIDAAVALGLAGFDDAGYVGEKYSYLSPPAATTSKAVIYELPCLISLNSDQTSYGATCGNGSGANNCCSTGNVATSYCYTGNSRSPTTCCAGTCGVIPSCCGGACDPPSCGLGSAACSGCSGGVEASGGCGYGPWASGGCGPGNTPV